MACDIVAKFYFLSEIIFSNAHIIWIKMRVKISLITIVLLINLYTKYCMPHIAIYEW